MTVLDLVTDAVADLGLLNGSEPLSGEDAALALSRLNDWIDALQVEHLTIPQRTRTTWTITANVQDYTVGSGSTVDVARPMLSDDLDIRFQDTSVSPVYERPLDLLTDQAWQGIPQKTLTAPYPIYAYYQPGTTTGTISLYFVPTATTLQGVLYAYVPVAPFAALTDTVTLAPGYRRFFRANLALELAGPFNVPQPPPWLTQVAMDSKRAIKLANVRMVDLFVDPALTSQHPSGYSIYSDT